VTRLWLEPVEAVTSAKIGRVEGRLEALRTGDHSERSCFFIRGSALPPGRHAQDVPAEDLGATLAQMLGLNVGGLDGRPLAGPALR
jgi:hypothetical protein